LSAMQIGEKTTHFDYEVIELDEQGNQHMTVVEPERKTERKTGKKEKNYGWAFFLASMFIGLGITATSEAPMGLFAGMGIGFLFFVPPIYKKVMSFFE